MAKIHNDITETIGNTPLVRLNRTAAAHGAQAEILLKLEFFPELDAPFILVQVPYPGATPKEVEREIGAEFAKPRALGGSETGGAAALPIWMKYMATALRGVPDEEPVIPDGVMALRVDPVTGVRADNDENGIYDYFYHENPPPEIETVLPSLFDGSENAGDAQLNQVQKLLQPEIVLPARPAATRPTDNTAKNPLNSH